MILRIKSKGETFLVHVDAEDYERVIAAGAWHIHRDRRRRYVRHQIRRPDGRPAKERLHNFILGIRGVDHIDGDGLNNRRSNLRPATNAQNVQNRCLQANNKSGFRGVAWDKTSQKWRAYLMVAGRRLNLGSFALAEDAGDAAKRARLSLMPFVNEARADASFTRGAGA